MFAVVAKCFILTSRIIVCCFKIYEILKLTEEKPVFGHISGKRANTHWIYFLKS